MNKLEQAAKQLLEHWDTPLWKQTEMTGTYMNALREALAKQADQEALKNLVRDMRIDMELKQKVYTALAEQAEQKPVAYLCPSFVDNFATGRYETCEQKDYGVFPVYAAPVRTKDLTDDEIEALFPKPWIELMTIKEFVRAVIAADREKNK